MRDLALMMTFLGILPFVLSRPYIGILLWSWFSYMNPHRLTYGFAYSFPFAMIIALVTIVAGVKDQSSKSIPWNGFTLTWLVFIVWFSITTIFAFHPDSAIPDWIMMLKVQLISFMTIMLCKQKHQIQSLIWVIAFSIGFYGIKGGISVISHGGQYKVFGPAQSSIADNNDLALALLMIVPLLRYCQSLVKKPWLSWLLLLMLGLVIASIIGSYSRGAMLAGVFVLLYYWLKGRNKLRNALVVAFGILVLLPLMPEAWFQRMNSINEYQEDGSAQGRINAWWTAFYVANDRITGGGFRTFSQDVFDRYAPVQDTFHDAHSIYFQVLGSHGYIGLVLFLLLGVHALRTANWLLHHTKNNLELKWLYELTIAVQVSLIAYASGGAFLTLANFDLYYQLLAILIVARQHVEQQAQLTPAKHRAKGSFKPWLKAKP